MNIMTISGSPRKKGNTATVLKIFETIVSENHEVGRINIADCGIKGCLGCLKCKEKPDDPGCVQDDNAGIVFERMMKTDVVVYATPLYCWSFSAQLKLLIDRHVCMVTGYGTSEYKSLVAGKKAALLVTCAGPIEGNTEPLQGIFDHFCDYLNLCQVGKYILPFCTTPDALGDQGRALAARMAKDICA